MNKHQILNFMVHKTSQKNKPLCGLGGKTQKQYLNFGFQFREADKTVYIFFKDELI